MSRSIRVEQQRQRTMLENAFSGRTPIYLNLGRSPLSQDPAPEPSRMRAIVSFRPAFAPLSLPPPAPTHVSWSRTSIFKSGAYNCTGANKARSEDVRDGRIVKELDPYHTRKR
jgi:hypothetical protein